MSDLHPWQVLNNSDDSYAWPGDEWGDAEAVQHILETCVFRYLDAEPGHICELASGAGCITQAVLRKYPGVQMDCFDISQEFLNQMGLRFADEIGHGQLRTTLLTEDPQLMYRELARASRVGRSIASFRSTPWYMSSCTASSSTSPPPPPF